MADSRPRDLAAHASRYDHDDFAKRLDALEQVANDAVDLNERFTGTWRKHANASTEGDFIHKYMDDSTGQAFDKDCKIMINKIDQNGEQHPFSDIMVGDECILDNTTKGDEPAKMIVAAVTEMSTYWKVELQLVEAGGQSDFYDIYEIGFFGEPAPNHEHSQYATKGDVESIEAELELLAKTLENGEWKVAATAAVQPGEMHLAESSLTAQQNLLTINNEDLNEKTHGWATLGEGDYVELLQRDEKRIISHDYGLFLVTKVTPGAGVLSLELGLYQGQGNAVVDEQFEVRILDIAESDLDMAALDDRYAKKSHAHTPGRKFKYGSAADTGGFAVTTAGLYVNKTDANGVVRKHTSTPDFTWSSPHKITIWTESGELWWAAESGQTTDWNSSTLRFKFAATNQPATGKLLLDKGLITNFYYWITIEGYW